jgi:hypothetical protein
MGCVAKTGVELVNILTEDFVRSYALGQVEVDYKKDGQRNRNCASSADSRTQPLYMAVYRRNLEQLLTLL